MSKHETPSIDLHRALETILFLSGKPLSTKKIAQLLGCDVRAAVATVAAFQTTWNARGGGTMVVVAGDAVQLASHPDCQGIAEAIAKDELRGELTRPQLEALTVIAYRGPITKAELEHIRGVHCGLILRNLLMRGLITSRRDSARGEDVYEASMDFLRHLGVADIRELPEYAALHRNAVISEYLATTRGEDTAPSVDAPPV
ncbi:MAG: SMC-Scp complex subunit ScpB [bacterium]|nr:SMC-Scp complex subunit ScpB [bacterium]